MSRIGLNSSVYNNTRTVSFQGGEQVLTTAQKTSKTLVREAAKLSPAIAIGYIYPEIGAALGTLIKTGIFKGAILKPFLIKTALFKGSGDYLGNLVTMDKIKKGLPSFMSELNITKLGGRVMSFLTDKARPELGKWI